MSDLGRMCIKCREEVLSGDFEARNDLHQLHAVTSTDLQRRVEQAFSFASQGVKVSLKTNWQGREYIEIHNGGSSYGQYFRAA
jgi:translation initiation factor IF-3